MVNVAPNDVLNIREHPDSESGPDRSKQMLWKQGKPLSIGATWAFAVAATAAASAGLTRAQQPNGFIFNGSKAESLAYPSENISLGERLPVTKLEKRFAHFRVLSTAGEDCLICASVEGSTGAIDVNYDAIGVKVTGIYSFDKNSVDSLGNSVGTPLVDAVGATAECDQGMWTSCTSPHLFGLHYIVDDATACPLNVPTGHGTTLIPRCARINGFEIR